MAASSANLTTPTSLLNIDTLDLTKAPHVVFLSSMTNPGGLFTIRDSTGGASKEPIMLSTTVGIRFLDGGGKNSNIFTINQDFGYLTLSPTSSKSWSVLNTFAFPDSTKVANIERLTTNALIASNMSVDRIEVINAGISSIYVDSFAIKTVDGFSMNISSSTLHYGLFSTSGAIYTGTPISTMSNLSVGGNASILQNTTIGGTLQVGLQTTLTGNVGIGAANTTTNALFVSGTQSITGATYLGNTLAVTSDTTVGGKIGVTGNTTIGGTLQTSLGATLLGNVGIGGASPPTTTLLVSGSQSNTGAVGIGGSLSVTGNTTMSGTLQTSLPATLAAPVGIGGQRNATNALLVTGSQSNTGDVGVGGALTLGGNTNTFHGTLSVAQGINLIGNVGIGGAGDSSYKLYVTGSETITGDLTVGGEFTIDSQSLNLPTTTINGNLAINGTFIAPLNVRHDYWTEPGSYTITPKSKKCSVTIVGGGGGGGAGSSPPDGTPGGGGGGGSGYRKTFIVEYSELTDDSYFDIRVGEGGSGGSSAWGTSTYSATTPNTTYNITNGFALTANNGYITSFAIRGGTIVNNGQGGISPNYIEVLGGGCGWNAGNHQAGSGGNGFCGGGSGYGGQSMYMGYPGSRGWPGFGIIPSQNGYPMNCNAPTLNKTYGGTSGQGGNITGVPMSYTSQIPEWNLISLANYKNYNANKGGVGYQGFGTLSELYPYTGDARGGGGGGGGPGGGNGGSCYFYVINTTTGLIDAPTITLNTSIPTISGFTNNAAQTRPGFAGTPGILGGGGGGGAGQWYNTTPGNGGKGGNGYVEITWL